MKRTGKLQPFAVAALLGLASGLGAPVRADDTDIYFSTVAIEGGESVNLPNVLLLLDTSESMVENRIDPGNPGSLSRIEALKSALRIILDQAGNVRIGLMRFSGDGQGGPVLYPIARVEDAASVVEGRDFPEVEVGITGGDNDAEETGDGTVILTSDRLGIPLRNAVQSFDLRIANPLNDASEFRARVNLDEGAPSSRGLIRFAELEDGRLAGFRFVGVPIPPNATVQEAYLELTIRGTINDDESALLDVRAERSGDAPGFNIFDLNNISERPRTAERAQWTVPITQQFEVVERSPNLSAVLQEIVGPPNAAPTLPLSQRNPLNWQAGEDMLLVASFESGGTKRYLTRDTDAAKAPRLVGTYVEPGADATPRRQLVGLRFEGVEFPQGAKVRSATIQFEAAADSDPTELAPPAVRIRGHRVPDSPPFTSADRNLSGRLGNATTQAVNWQVPAFTEGARFQSPDLKDVVQEIVNQGGASGWCGGNAMTFFIDTEAVGNNALRFARAFESTAGGAPVLRIELEKDPALNALAPNTNGCTTKTVQLRVSSPFDDATESERNGSVALEQSTYDLADDSRITGLRFRDVPVPAQAEITDARLLFTANGIGDGIVNVNISAQQSTASEPFSLDGRDISSRAVSTPVPWNVDPWEGLGQVDRTPNLADLVRPLVQSGTWRAGASSLAFVLERTDTGRELRTAQSYDGTPTNAPALRITYRTAFDPQTDVTFVPVRERLLRVVNDMQPFGGTPLVEAMYEAARYFRGDTVQFGRQRGDQSAITSRTRVSHPASYIGPDPLRPAGCTETDLSNPNCIGELIPDGAVYDSPIRATAPCEANYLIVLSDGLPNPTTNVEEIQALIGDTCEARPEGGQCGPELARFLATADQRSDDEVPGTQRVFTYTISFGDTTGTAFLNELAEEGRPGDSETSFFTASNAGELVDVFNDIIASVLGRTSSFAAPSLSINAFNQLFHLNEVYFALFAPSSSGRWDGNVKKFNLCDSSIPDTAPPCVPGEVLDANFRSAVFPADASVPEEDRGRIRPTALSEWTDPSLTPPDGATVTEGGAASVLPSYTQRNVYTYTGDDAALASVAQGIGPNNRPDAGLDLTDSISNRVSASDPDSALVDNTALTRELLGVDDDATRDEVVLWMRGKDVLRRNTASGSLDRFAFGDPLHSSPVAVTYGQVDGEAITKVFVGTNDGTVRMLNGSTGVEEWAFFPQDLLPIQKSLMDNLESNQRIYGMDGAPTLWVNDLDNDGTIEPGDGEFVYLFIGMRRGGRNYYALNVTPDNTLTSNAFAVGGTPTIKPRLIWRIRGGTGDFERLGQTWSRPILTNILFRDPNNSDNVSSRPVLIFGGGYDPLFDEGFTETPEQGNAIYIVDPHTGERIWWASNGDTVTRDDGTTEIADLVLDSENTGQLPSVDGRRLSMSYSIPSDLALLDTDGDGNTNRVYVGDVGGNLWRIDLDALNSLDDGATSGAALAVLSDLNTLPDSTELDPRDARSFFHAPDVVQVRDPSVTSGSKRHDIVAIVSGRRPDPLNTAVHDRIYALRDFNTDGRIAPDFGEIIRSSAAPAGDLYDATDDLIPANATDPETLTRSTELANAKGWFIELREPGVSGDAAFIGEKGLSSPVILAGTMFVTTFVPQVDASDPCAAKEGLGRLYGLNVLNGNAVNNWDNPGGTGPLTPRDRVFGLGSGIPSDVVPVFLEGGDIQLLVGTGGGDVTVDPNIDLPRERTYWFQQ